MRYRVTETKWQNADHEIKLGNQKIPAASSTEWLPEKEDRIGEIYQRGRKRKTSATGRNSGPADSTGTGKAPGHGSSVATGQDSNQVSVRDGIEIGGRFYEVKPVSKSRFKGFATKNKGWIQVTGEGGRTGYILVRGFRILWIPVAVLIAVAIFSMSLYGKTGVAPVYQLQYIADQTGITAGSNKPKAEITSYSAYQSVPDQIWTAGETHQEITLALPATVTAKDKYNRDTSYRNPVDAAPHLYVDLDGDGNFTEEECLFNPMTIREDGTIEDIGALLQAGNQIDSVELSQPIDAGEYDAQVVWTGITTDTHVLANPMTFRFHLTVQ